MDSFPSLKTGAVVQYPASRVTQFSTDTIQFVDGAEQRFRGFAQPYHSWIVNFDNLDETELQTLRAFVQSMSGAVGEFSFTDPWDGTVYPKCSFQGTEFVDSLTGPVRGTIRLTIRELQP